MRGALFVALAAGVLLQHFTFCDIHSAVVRPFKSVQEMAEVGARYTPKWLQRFVCAAIQPPFVAFTPSRAFCVLPACFLLLRRSRDDGGGDFFTFVVAAVEAFVAPSTRAPCEGGTARPPRTPPLRITPWPSKPLLGDPTARWWRR
jgi:hypothetical protein